MNQLTKEEYRELVGCVRTVQNLLVTQPFPTGMSEVVRKMVTDNILERSAELQALIDKVCRIHLD